MKATAEKNEDFLLKTLDTDEGARGVGEFAIGTNEGIQQFTRQILFDEKIGGCFHMALGKGYPETGSRPNPPSTGTWSATCATAGRSGWMTSCSTRTASSSSKDDADYWWVFPWCTHGTKIVPGLVRRARAQATRPTIYYSGFPETETRFTS